MVFCLFAQPLLATTAAELLIAERRAAVVERASRLLDEAQVSYVYGGHQLGDSATCNACNACLNSSHPAPSERLRRCPTCQSCSLDCSHFTALVYAQAQLPYPYLDTALMLSLSPRALRGRYQLTDLGTDLAAAAPGDLLVYKGHVVLLERVVPVASESLPGGPGPVWRGDVVHATGGQAIRRPGEGIQRERFADLAHFRGPLLRILRHQQLTGPGAPAAGVAVLPRAQDRPVRAHPVPLGRLRPVLRQAPAAGDGG